MICLDLRGLRPRRGRKQQLTQNTGLSTRLWGDGHAGRGRGHFALEIGDVRGTSNGVLRSLDLVTGRKKTQCCVRIRQSVCNHLSRYRTLATEARRSADTQAVNAVRAPCTPSPLGHSQHRLPVLAFIIHSVYASNTARRTWQVRNPQTETRRRAGDYGRKVDRAKKTALCGDR